MGEHISKRNYSYPFNIEREYQNFLYRYLKTIETTDLKLDEDDDNEEVEKTDIISDLTTPLVVLFISQLFNEVNKFAQSDMTKEINSAFRKENERLQRQIDLFNATMDNTGINAIQKQFIDENVLLIKNIAEQYRFKIRELEYLGMTKEELAEGIAKIKGMTKNRAELIAVDQIGKLNGKMQQFYQQSMGCKEYIWQTMRDNRVREQHRRREGKKYSWDNPPEGGHPSMAVRCRCKAKPIFID